MFPTYSTSFKHLYRPISHRLGENYKENQKKDYVRQSVKHGLFSKLLNADSVITGIPGLDDTIRLLADPELMALASVVQSMDRELTNVEKLGSDINDVLIDDKFEKAGGKFPPASTVDKVKKIIDDAKNEEDAKRRNNSNTSHYNNDREADQGNEPFISEEDKNIAIINTTYTPSGSEENHDEYLSRLSGMSPSELEAENKRRNAEIKEKLDVEQELKNEELSALSGKSPSDIANLAADKQRKAEEEANEQASALSGRISRSTPTTTTSKTRSSFLKG